MKTFKTLEIPARAIKFEKVLDEILCDICKKPIRRDGGKVDEVTLQHRTGFSYPEGGSGEVSEYDICGRCFAEKIVPFMEQLGSKPRIEDWDF